MTAFRSRWKCQNCIFYLLQDDYIYICIYIYVHHSIIMFCCTDSKYCGKWKLTFHYPCWFVQYLFFYCNPTVGITFHYNLSYPIASPINKMLGLCIKELWLVAEKSSKNIPIISPFGKGLYLSYPILSLYQ